MKRRKYHPCKYCGKEIQTNQRKCPFCGKYLYDYLKTMSDFSRNKEIVRRRKGGATLRELGIEYGLSQQRIREIYQKFG